MIDTRKSWTVAAMAVTALAAPASATVIEPVCANAPAAARFVDHTATGGPDWQYVSPASVGDGFVFWQVTDLYGQGDASEWLVLEHCKGSRDKLIVRVGPNREAVLDRYHDMAFGAAPYTLRQMGEALAPLGAGVRIAAEDFGGCACNPTDWRPM